MHRNSSQGKSTTYRAVSRPFGTIIGKPSLGLIQGVHPYVSDIVGMDGWMDGQAREGFMGRLRGTIYSDLNRKLLIPPPFRGYYLGLIH
jgi:hypothetical protein